MSDFKGVIHPDFSPTNSTLCSVVVSRCCWTKVLRPDPRTTTTPGSDTGWFGIQGCRKLRLPVGGARKWSQAAMKSGCPSWMRIRSLNTFIGVFRISCDRWILWGLYVFFLDIGQLKNWLWFFVGDVVVCFLLMMVMSCLVVSFLKNWYEVHLGSSAKSPKIVETWWKLLRSSSSPPGWHYNFSRTRDLNLNINLQLLLCGG